MDSPFLMALNKISGSEVAGPGDSPFLSALNKISGVPVDKGFTAPPSPESLNVDQTIQKADELGKKGDESYQKVREILKNDYGQDIPTIN